MPNRGMLQQRHNNAASEQIIAIFVVGGKFFVLCEKVKIECENQKFFAWQ